MVSSRSVVSTVDELLAVAGKAGACTIVVQGQLVGVPGFSLAPGLTLEGQDEQALIAFAPG